jgi:thioredoxin-related protein
MEQVDWQKWFFDYKTGLEEARKRRKPLLLQFHREECSGCRKLYAETYPEEQAITELYEWFVPLRQDILENREVRSRYSAYWTPSFYVLDYRGKSFYSFNGYLEPEDFRVFLRLGYAAYLLPRGKYRETIVLMEDGVAKFPDNPRTASMLFTKGMAEYLTGRDKVAFYDTMSEIRTRYPDSLEARTWPFVEA